MLNTSPQTGKILLCKEMNVYAYVCMYMCEPVYLCVLKDYSPRLSEHFSLWQKVVIQSETIHLV